MPSAPRRLAVYVNCDGLGAGWLRFGSTPALAALQSKGVAARNHHAVFPSVTRCSAASVTTGCFPGKHGLHGNRMALWEHGKLVVRDVGPPDFREHMRRATGGTLRVPTLAERVSDKGGFIAFSNVSPGAAYFLDPEHHGFVYHRAGSYGPGGKTIPDQDHLAVSHDLAGDVAMTERFCAEVIANRKPTIAVLWLANPDLTLHSSPLGSPEHLHALRTIDDCVARVIDCVARERSMGDDILLMAGSDHGQETVLAGIDISSWLAGAGLADALAAGELAVAAQGSAALIYATPSVETRFAAIVSELTAQPWVGRVILGDALSLVGQRKADKLIAAIDLARIAQNNPFNIPFARYVAIDGEKPAAPGFGQHGGLGPDETRPFLIIDHPQLQQHAIMSRSSLVDIAPTILTFLGLATNGIDGHSLLAPNATSETTTHLSSTPV